MVLECLCDAQAGILQNKGLGNLSKSLKALHVLVLGVTHVISAVSCWLPKSALFTEGGVTQGHGIAAEGSLEAGYPQGTARLGILHSAAIKLLPWSERPRASPLTPLLPLPLSFGQMGHLGLAAWLLMCPLPSRSVCGKTRLPGTPPFSLPHVLSHPFPRQALRGCWEMTVSTQTSILLGALPVRMGRETVAD